MSVSEKSREIAILLTMGMKKQQITAIFTLMGFLQGLRSTVIGVVLGCSLSYLITPFTSNFKNYFGFELLNENIYFINFIPSVLSFTDVLIVTVCSLLMSISWQPYILQSKPQKSLLQTNFLYKLYFPDVKNQEKFSLKTSVIFHLC